MLRIGAGGNFLLLLRYRKFGNMSNDADYTGMNRFGELRSDDKRTRTWVWILGVFALLCACTAFADFSTKGEPREALVAVEMLKSGNPILPIDASGDMAYKPPMFHWLVALCSLPAGHVSEFTSRLPSALALTVLMWITWRFCAVRRSENFGLLCAMLMLTSFEVFRAGTVCRVDMVLTAWIAGAMVALFMSRTGSREALYLLIATLCISGGVLTKGPVAALLPLGAYWVWRLLRCDNFFRVTGISLAVGVLSLLLPALWYYAAYRQGGDRFLTLAMEENFGRFLGKMTYESHVQPLWYNFTSLAAGWLPWSAAVVVSLSLRPVRRMFRGLRLREWWRSADPEARFALVAAAVMFVFYCIPKSKRSVYLLPMYPFMAYYLGAYAVMLVRAGVIKSRTVIRTLSVVLLLFAFGFGVAFPIISKRHSDREKAAQIAAIVPEGMVYSFAPDRFARYYVTDFYLGGRLCNLSPSMQTTPGTGKPDACDMRIPAEAIFYLLTPAELFETADPSKDLGLHAWLSDNNLQAQPVYKADSKTHDVKSIPVLLKIARK